MAEPITCLIVDDHEVVREGLRLALSRTENIRVVGEAADGSAAVALAKRRRPNVVIMDVRMPGTDGLQAAREITTDVPEAAVLMFTAYGERPRQHLRRGDVHDRRHGDRDHGQHTRLGDTPERPRRGASR